MSPYFFLIPLLLIPVDSFLNHLGGQSTTIPHPRFTCRMLGIGISFGLVAWASQVGSVLSSVLGIACIASQISWAVWKNGPEFMSINKTDYRLYGTPWYEPNYWITKACDKIMGTKQGEAITASQCQTWGVWYGTFLGAILYPFFAYLGIILTPWAYLIGLICLLQGLEYRFSGSVLKAEYVIGAINLGGARAAILILYLMQQNGG